MLLIREDEHGLRFKVLVQPRSRKNEIVGLHGGALKIKITAPPVEGAANSMCIGFLAKCLKISKSSIGIVSGHTSRTKLIQVNLPSLPESEEKTEQLKAAIQSLVKQQKPLD